MKIPPHNNITAGSPTARKYSRRLSPPQVCGSAVSLFSSGASSQTVINCFCLAYPPLRPKKEGFPLRKSFFFCSKSVHRLGHSCVSNVGIAARSLLHFSCSAFYIRILTSARRARYRTRRYAAFSVQSASSSLVSGKRENIHLW